MSGNRIELCTKSLLLFLQSLNQKSYFQLVGFGSNYEYVCVTIVHNPRGIQGKNFSYTHEFAYFVIPKGDKIIGVGTGEVPTSFIHFDTKRFHFFN